MAERLPLIPITRPIGVIGIPEEFLPPPIPFRVPRVRPPAPPPKPSEVAPPPPKPPTVVAPPTPPPPEEVEKLRRELAEVESQIRSLQSRLVELTRRRDEILSKIRGVPVAVPIPMPPERVVRVLPIGPPAPPRPPEKVFRALRLRF